MQVTALDMFPKKKKKKIGFTHPLNVCDFKTKPPDDEWSTPYDRALQNTAFVKKNDESSPHVGLFRKVPTEAKSNSY